MPRRLLVTALLVAAPLVAGCTHHPDDEMVVPSVTRTAAPRPPTDLPRLPVGHAGLSPDAVVTVSGSVVTAGGRVLDVMPLRMGAHVVTAGGIYFLSAGELWFTDLRRLVPTPYRKVRSLAVTPDRTRLTFVDLQHGAPGQDGAPRPVRIRYDVRTGRPVGATYLPS